MELIPPDIQDAGRGDPAAGNEERRAEATSRVPRRRFTFDLSHSTRAIVIALGGELDVICADTFKRRLAEATEAEPDDVVIDLRELTFMDSTGLALLLAVNDMSRDGGFTLTLVSTGEGFPSRIFRMTGTDKILPLVEEPPDLDD
jgi:anti-sigma B factor antagonist